MELAPDHLRTLLTPSALYSSAPPTRRSPVGQPSAHSSWSTSSLNPRNRIDSLTPVQGPRWRIEGACNEGTQYQVLPIPLLGRLPPTRIDVHLPPYADIPDKLRGPLDLAAAFHITDGRIRRLGIAQYVLRVLEAWSDRTADWEAIYLDAPHGSYIQLSALCAQISQVHVDLHPRDPSTGHINPDDQWLSPDDLAIYLALEQSAWPPVADIADLRITAQIHDTISLVHFRDDPSDSTVAFKSTLTAVKYLYHELKVLLALPPHPNVISRPLQIVTAQHGSRLVVCGFTLNYHALGSLKNVIAYRAHAGNLKRDDQYRWAEQITRALIHVNEQGGTFYSELKLDNILVTQSDSSEKKQQDIVLADFEQRANWHSWAAPEITHVEIFEELVESGYFAPDSAAHLDFTTYLHQIPTVTPAAVPSPIQSYFTAWTVLSAAAQHAAEVFSLGKTLWCLFEGVSNMNTNIRISHAREPDYVFPEFRHTPHGLRDLIRRCTYGAPEWKGRATAGVVRYGDRVWPAEGYGGVPETKRGGDGEDEVKRALAVHDAARRWWEEEVDRGTRFFAHKARQVKEKENGDAAAPEADDDDDDPEEFDALRRASLREVLEELARSRDAELSDADKK
ncbi:MAG: hypothetical protein M1817_003229 [Caeruleum heppii]|nr:MAG: hypothetical protein M1817_003229 [Caeruleum heppii]